MSATYPEPVNPLIVTRERVPAVEGWLKSKVSYCTVREEILADSARPPSVPLKVIVSVALF
jgi:hypothetical protein